MQKIPQSLSEQERACQVAEVEWKAAQATAKEKRQVFESCVNALRHMIVEESDPGIFRGLEAE